MLGPTIEFVPERSAEILATVPKGPAVFMLRGSAGEPYVSKTTDLKRRLLRLLGPPEEQTKKLSLRDRVRTIEYRLTGSEFESGFLLYQTLRASFPRSYRQRLRLRFAPLIKFELDNRYPRAYVSQRLSRIHGKNVYYGPFPSRAAAEKFLHDSLDLFKMRRCDFELHPDPGFPGCIYSEMKMCLAPCFRGCSDEEYAREVERVRGYLDSGGRSLVRELEAEREQAAAGLEFEQAAAIHARVEKVSSLRAPLPEAVRRLDELRAVMVQKAADPNAVALFPIERGQIAAPLLFLVQTEGSQAQSMETRVRDLLQGAPSLPRLSVAELMEHLAIFKRWYYRSSRAGEIFFSDDKGELPLRRLVRGIARVFRGETTATVLEGRHRVVPQTL